MSELPKIAVMASGSGSTAETLIEGIRSGTLQAKLDLLITNNPDAGVLERVARFNNLGMDIDTMVMNTKLAQAVPGLDEFSGEPTRKGEQSPREAAAIARELGERGIKVVVMLGYMKKIVPPLVSDQFVILNTHPGLLPDSEGLYGIHVQEHVIANHLPYAGQTLHYANEDYDRGDVIAEHRVAVRPDHTPETLFADVQVVEKANIAPDVNEVLKSLNLID